MFAPPLAIKISVFNKKGRAYVKKGAVWEKRDLCIEIKQNPKDVMDERCYIQ